MMKLFLLVVGVFLIPIALSYGVDPAATLPKFMNITVEGIDQTHIFRALMCISACRPSASSPRSRRSGGMWR
jgi:hypothetical protein